MKYANFSDVLLSYFRLDDNGETLVLTDKLGYTRAVRLLPYETRPQGDLISREALLKAIRDYAEPSSKLSDDFSKGITECACEVLDIIDNVPPVEHICPYLSDNEVKQPCLNSPCERPQGEWIEEHGLIACSNCHTIWLYRTTDFCPHCGADMRGGSKNE